MADIFVNSGAGGANTGADWTNAFLSLASANGQAAGGNVYIHKTHSQTGLTSTINFANGTVTSPVKLICVDKDAGDVTATGAVVSWSTANTGLTGNVDIYGVTLGGAGTNTPTLNSNGGGGLMRFDTCTISQTGSSGPRIGNVARDQFRFLNCTFDFSGASANTCTIVLPTASGDMEVVGGTITCRGGGQTNLLTGQTGSGGTVEFRGVNISGTVTNLLSSSTSSGPGVLFDQCAMPTYTNVFSTQPTSYYCRVEIRRSTNGTISVPRVGPDLIADRAGQIAASLARYRTGGANDNQNANAYSWEMVANASALAFSSWLETPPIALEVAAGAQTVTLYIASGGTLKDDEFWIEVLSPSEAGSPTSQAKYQTTKAAYKAAGANITSDGTSTWNGAGVGTAQKVSVSISPTVAGYVVLRGFFAKASGTVYVDPKPVAA